MDIIDMSTPEERTYTVELTETEAEAIRSIFWFGFPSGLTYTSARTGKTVRIDGIIDPLAKAGVGVSEQPNGTEYDRGKAQPGWALNDRPIQLERDWDYR